MNPYWHPDYHTGWLSCFKTPASVQLTEYHETHDDVIKWKHFPRYWPFVRGIHRSPVNSPHKGQWHGAFMFSLICVWINDWVNNREAGHLRRYRAHYDVIVMFSAFFPLWGKPPVTGGYSSQWSVIAESWCLFFSLFLAWTSCWINSWVASDLRRGHANVTAMVHIHFDRLYKRIGQCARSCNDKANIMMTSWNENILRVTGPLFGESTGSSVDLQIYCNVSKVMIHSACLRQYAIKYSDAELSCFLLFLLWSASEQTVEHTIDKPVISDAMPACYDVFVMFSNIFTIKTP